MQAKNADPSTAIRVGNHQEPTGGRPSDSDETVFAAVGSLTLTFVSESPISLGLSNSLRPLNCDLNGSLLKLSREKI